MLPITFNMYDIFRLNLMRYLKELVVQLQEEEHFGD